MTKTSGSKDGAALSRTNPTGASEFDRRALELLFKQIEIIIGRNEGHGDLKEEENLRVSEHGEECGAGKAKLDFQTRVMVFRSCAAAFFLLVGAVLTIRGFQDVGLFVLGCAAGLLVEVGVSAI